MPTRRRQRNKAPPRGSIQLIPLGKHNKHKRPAPKNQSQTNHNHVESSHHQCRPRVDRTEIPLLKPCPLPKKTRKSDTNAKLVPHDASAAVEKPSWASITGIRRLDEILVPESNSPADKDQEENDSEILQIYEPNETSHQMPPFFSVSSQNITEDGIFNQYFLDDTTNTMEKLQASDTDAVATVNSTGTLHNEESHNAQEQNHSVPFIQVSAVEPDSPSDSVNFFSCHQHADILDADKETDSRATNPSSSSPKFAHGGELHHGWTPISSIPHSQGMEEDAIFSLDDNDDTLDDDHDICRMGKLSKSRLASKLQAGNGTTATSQSSIGLGDIVETPIDHITQMRSDSRLVSEEEWYSDETEEPSQTDMMHISFDDRIVDATDSGMPTVIPSYPSIDDDLQREVFDFLPTTGQHDRDEEEFDSRVFHDTLQWDELDDKPKNRPVLPETSSLPGVKLRQKMHLFMEDVDLILQNFDNKLCSVTARAEKRPIYKKFDVDFLPTTVEHNHATYPLGKSQHLILSEWLHSNCDSMVTADILNDLSMRSRLPEDFIHRWIRRNKMKLKCDKKRRQKKRIRSLTLEDFEQNIHTQRWENKKFSSIAADSDDAGSITVPHSIHVSR